MMIINAFSGVGVEGISRTLHPVLPPTSAAAQHAYAAPAGMAVVAAPAQRMRRTAAATGVSVDRGTT